ncbi:hypothetical protein V3481_016205 [Fusarium oxysporum f. sp. vasinfectum]
MVQPISDVVLNLDAELVIFVINQRDLNSPIRGLKRLLPIHRQSPVVQWFRAIVIPAAVRSGRCIQDLDRTLRRG